MIQNNIKKYYKDNVVKNSLKTKKDLLIQVGKTFLGEVIDDEQFNLIIDSIKDNLKLNKNDRVLDLGCANGILTYEISHFIKEINGFDLSPDLISVANKSKNKKNIDYQVADILDIDFKKRDAKKIYMYEVLQHFDGKMLRKLLEKMNNTFDEFTLFVASIPDASKLFEFYDTKERKKYYFFEVLENGKFHIGNWWHREHILMLCEEIGLSAKIIEQDNKLHTAHYRFDILIEKKK